MKRVVYICGGILMNKIRKILLSILSIPMILSSSVSRATTSIEVIYNNKKVKFEEGKLGEAEYLLKQVSDRFYSNNEELDQVRNFLNSYGIDIDKAPTYKRVVEVLKKHNTLNFGSIKFIKSWVNEYLGNSEVDFVVDNCYETIISYIKDIRELKSLEGEFNRLSQEEQEKKTNEKNEIENKKKQMKIRYGRCLTSDDPDCISRCVRASQEALNAKLCVKDVLRSCRDLHNISDISFVLDRLPDILLKFSGDSNRCADTLLPKLNRAIELKGENARYNKALKHDLNYWYEDQWRWIKRFGNFISFADTTDEGKANRAIDNYIEEMKIALGKGSASSNVGTCLFLGTAIIGGAVYCLYESVDGEVVCVPKKSAQNYEQDNEYDDDDYDE